MCAKLFSLLQSLIHLFFFVPFLNQCTNSTCQVVINQFIFSLSLSSAFKAVNTLKQWYSVEHILFHLQSLFLFVCDLRYKIWYLYTPAKRCIAGVVNLISLEELKVFFSPNLKRRAKHAFSVNYIPSIIEKKNLAVVWLQCVSSSAWAGEAQFDYRSDFFFVQTDECDTEHWYQLKYFACPPVRLFSLQSQCTARIRGNKAAKAGTRIYIYCKKTKLELPASHSRRLSSLLS